MDMDSFDPNWEFAVVHGKASKIGYIKKDSP